MSNSPDVNTDYVSIAFINLLKLLEKVEINGKVFYVLPAEVPRSQHFGETMTPKHQPFDVKEAALDKCKSTDSKLGEVYGRRAYID